MDNQPSEFDYTKSLVLVRTSEYFPSSDDLQTRVVGCGFKTRHLGLGSGAENAVLAVSAEEQFSKRGDGVSVVEPQILYARFITMQRVPVISPEGIPLMPTKPSRARRWLRDGKAAIYPNDLNIFAIQLTRPPSGTETKPIAIGVDPGKLYSGIAIQSQNATLWTGHLVLNFKRVKERMGTRAMMRRTRRSRRINRKVSYRQRAHRQKRFDNRRGHKLPPSIRSNRQLEIRVVTELSALYPITDIVYEIVKANGSKSFSPVMVGQNWAVSQLEKIAPVTVCNGWETANMRDILGLVKNREKSQQVLETHAVDGIALAATVFNHKLTSHGRNSRVVSFENATVTPAPFAVVRRPPISRRLLHLLQFAKGGKRRKYGETITRHGVRKGDECRGDSSRENLSRLG